MAKKLHRSNSQKVLGGVAGGIAEYFDIDPVLVRILFLIALFGAGASILVYIIMWIIIPVSPYMPENFYHENYNPSEPNNQSKDSKNPSESNSFEYSQSDSDSSRSLKLFFGIALIVIGLLSFLDQFIHIIDFKWLFPSLLIAIGVYLMFRAGEKE